MRVVVSIGGSVLAPDLEPDRVREHARVIDSLIEDGHEVAAVVGGGDVARRYIGTARELGATEYDLDQRVDDPGVLPDPVGFEVRHEHAPADRNDDSHCVPVALFRS